LLFDASVSTQCRLLRGGGADLVKMARDPRTVPFTEVTQYVEGDITYPLLQNSNGIIIWNGQFFYADKLTKTVKKIEELNIHDDQKAAFTAFQDSLNAMEDNSSRRSSNNEHALIMSTLGIILERRAYVTVLSIKIQK
jgi:hypothetical protein